jgi:hypothetical protein
MLELSQAGRYVAGVLLLSVVTIEVGGWFMTRIAAGRVPMTQFQKSFARAGHGHAGVLVMLGLIGVLLADAAELDGAVGWVARLGVPVAAVFMSAGFFLASAGRGQLDRPNRLIAVVWIGAVCLAAGVLSLGIGLLTASPR